MKQFLKMCGLVGVLMLVLTGCRTGAIYNIEQNPISTKQTSSKAIYKAIVTAGASLGWKMEKVADGEILGTLTVRNHVAKVQIKYDTTKYAITYLSSINLKYDATKQTIHKNYNGWIHNLERTIDVQMSMLDI